MIDKKVFEFPTYYTNPIGRIAIGWGVYQTVATECKAANIKKALITTTGLKGTGIVEEIDEILTSNGISTEIYNKVTSNPKDYEVMEAYQVFKNTGCDGVVSIGGGSSHDCGKGVRAVFTYAGRDISEMSAARNPRWVEQSKSELITIPQICVNTTAGTGAETSAGAAIVNTKDKIKIYVTAPGLPSRLALIDPLLVRLMPQHIAAWTGFDALAHAFESFVHKSRSEYNKALQLRAMKLVSENLREFAYNRNNHDACENMCWAESLAVVGLNFAGGIGIVHGLGDGLSALYDTHHGRTNGVLAIPLERYNEPACPEKFAEMAQAMGVDTRGLTTVQASDKWFVEIERLLQDLDIRSGHLNEQFGLKRDDIEHIATKQYYGGSLANRGNPREYNANECIKLLESLY
jgi:formaldehyde dismutase / methanol dehydrogenase